MKVKRNAGYHFQRHICNATLPHLFSFFSSISSLSFHIKKSHSFTIYLEKNSSQQKSYWLVMYSNSARTWATMQLTAWYGLGYLSVSREKKWLRFFVATENCSFSSSTKVRTIVWANTSILWMIQCTWSNMKTYIQWK